MGTFAQMLSVQEMNWLFEYQKSLCLSIELKKCMTDFYCQNYHKKRIVSDYKFASVYIEKNKHWFRV